MWPDREEPISAKVSGRWGGAEALAFVKSVNNDLRLYGLPPLDDGYVMRALGQASRTYLA